MNIWSSAGEICGNLWWKLCEWNSDIIFHWWKQEIQTATKIYFLKRKMCLIWNSIRRINVLSRISSFCFQTFGLSLTFFSCFLFFFLFLRPLRTSSDQIRTVDAPGMRIGLRWKPCQPAVIFSHIYIDSLLRLLTFAPAFPGWALLFPGLWPLPPLCPLRKNFWCGCWKLTERSLTDSTRIKVQSNRKMTVFYWNLLSVEQEKTKRASMFSYVSMSMNSWDGTFGLRGHGCRVQHTFTT